MKSSFTKATLTVLFAATAILLQAQEAQTSPAPGGTSGNLFIYGIIGVALLIFLFIIINVSDNLMVIEARQSGADATGANFSLFPSRGELFRSRLPLYLRHEKVTTIRKGRDLNLLGKAEPMLDTSMQVTRFALQPPNFLGLQPIPKLTVEVGDTIKAGDPVFFDKNMPDIKFTAPVSGEVIAVNRGLKRAINEIVILADKEQQFRSFDVPDFNTASRDQLVAFLIESGAWLLIRQRPYNVIANPTEVPRDIFISTFDTAPLAPDLNFVVEGRADAFQRGLDVLRKLTYGNVYLGLDARGKQAPSPAFTEAQGVEKRWFRGPHPTGNVGVQIHHIAPVGPRDRVWTLGVQEVITLGELFLTGRFLMERIVALTGAELATPKYVRTYAGANIAELLGDNLVTKENVRFISGDVLSGEQRAHEGFLNFHDDQLTVIAEGNEPELFGWLLPISERPTTSPTVPSYFIGEPVRATTNMHGEKRAFVTNMEYEAFMPMDIYTEQLMKAIIVNDYEGMEGLGIHELVEEDVALAEFACVSKQPLQQILRRGLETMREQS